MSSTREVKDFVHDASRTASDLRRVAQAFSLDVQGNRKQLIARIEGALSGKADGSPAGVNLKRLPPDPGYKPGTTAPKSKKSKPKSGTTGTKVKVERPKPAKPDDQPSALQKAWNWFLKH